MTNAANRITLPCWPTFRHTVWLAALLLCCLVGCSQDSTSRLGLTEGEQEGQEPTEQEGGAEGAADQGEGEGEGTLEEEGSGTEGEGALEEEGSGAEGEGALEEEGSESEGQVEEEGAEGEGALETEGAEGEGALETEGAEGEPPPEPVRIRIMASNLTSGDHSSYDPPPSRRLLKGLRADVYLMQEFNYGDNNANDIEELLNDIDCRGCAYFREPRGSIPNGVISRYPIRQSGSWDDPEVNDRGFAWARIDVPGDRDLWAISLHLLTSSATDRNAQARALVSLIRTHIPAEDLLVLGGDLNTNNRGESCLETLSQFVVTDRRAPIDQSGNGNTNRKREKPYDWVLADPDLDRLHTSVVSGNHRFPHGLVFDSQDYEPLADVAPILEGDSRADNMQHMAVIREFLLPVN